MSSSNPEATLNILGLYRKPDDYDGSIIPRPIYEDYYWASLDCPAKAAASTLGWSQETWDNSVPIPFEKKNWNNLTIEEKLAATHLGYNKRVFARRRIDTANGEKAMFISGRGLVGPKHFFNSRQGGVNDEEYKNIIIDGRDVLFQSQENYELLIQDRKVGVFFEDYYKDQTENGFESGAPSIELVLSDPTFGEQVIVNGCESSRISIGDIFEVEDGSSDIKLEVASPRFPCGFVDRKHNAPFGAKGMRTHSMTRGLAGWFCRVLVKGELRDGMRLVRTEHAHSQWTLTFISQVLWNEGTEMDSIRGKASWSRDIELLRELVNLPALPEYEWKVKAREVLAEKEKEVEEKEIQEANERLEQEAQKDDVFCGFNFQAAIFAAGCACIAPALVCHLV